MSLTAHLSSLVFARDFIVPWIKFVGCSSSSLFNVLLVFASKSLT